MDALTAEGYDMQWGTNVLGHFYLTELLLPALEAGARSSADGHARIITTASSGAYTAKICFEAFRDSATRRKIGDMHLYSMSKLVRMARSSECARKAEGEHAAA